MDLYLVSDLHHYPEPQEHPGRLAFLDFLDGLRRLDAPGALWILGDLFDFWYEYGTVVPAGHERLLVALGDLSRAGWSLHLLSGNHDFCAGRRFSACTGGEIHRDRFLELEHGGRRIVLAHGDGLGRGDAAYRLVRPLLRSRAVLALFSLLHPDIGMRLADAFSGTSRRILRRDLDHVPAGLEEWAARRLSAGVDLVVTGHAHLGRIARLPGGLHVSLGDWLTRWSYCIVPEDSGVEPLLLSHRPGEGIPPVPRSLEGGGSS